MTHPSKTVVYTGIALVSLFIIFASFWYRDQIFKTASPTQSVTATHEAVRVNSITEKAVTYNIDVRYPTLSSTIEGSKVLNDTIANIYKKRAEEFKQQAIESYTTAPKELLNKDISSYYNVSFSQEASTTRFLSFIVSTESYFIGMAHPSHDIDTFIIDMKTKKLVSPEELFIPNSSYTKTLSALCRADFDARNRGGDVDDFKVDTSLHNDGFMPTQENFSRILPLQDGLMIYFNEYQIAPYSAGPQQAVIPYDKLRSIINPQGILGEYIK
jgi:hypothetical protein